VTPQELNVFFYKVMVYDEYVALTYICTKLNLKLHNKLFSNIETNIFTLPLIHITCR
jgi:hypothetical protein